MRACLGLGGLRIGKSSAFWGMPTFVGGDDCLTRLVIGEACGFNYGCHFELYGDISIADNVSVGHQVLFLTRTHDTSNPNQRGTAAESKPIRVEPGAWLGARCVILPGVTIGAGSVIAAETIVRENVGANLLVTGNRKISIAKWR